jgi:hypothetical protein
MVVFPESADKLAAVRYAAMSSGACVAELRARRVRFEHTSSDRKLARVATPVRFEPTLGGVRFDRTHPSLEPEQPGPLADCSLVLALTDLANIVRRHDVVAVRYLSMHRRGRGAPHRGHGGGVAIDVTGFQMADGAELDIKRDFGGHGIGSRTCGPQAPEPKTPRAVTLRKIVCDLDRARAFNLVLTPHYDFRHRDHLHLEVRGKIRWFLTQ